MNDSMDVYFLTTKTPLTPEKLNELEKIIEKDNAKLEVAYFKHSVPLPDEKGSLGPVCFEQSMGYELVISGRPTFLWLGKYELLKPTITLGKIADYMLASSKR